MAVYRKKTAPEAGAIKKEWGGKVPVAIVYPNTYYIGMSNLAVHQLYRLMNRDPAIVAERVFLPAKGKALSEESGRPLSDFKVAAFSFSFETDYLNIPRLLGPNISLKKGNRTKHDPVLIAGGPAVTLNPKALADVFDVIIPGEVEAVIDELTEWIKTGGRPDSVISGNHNTKPLDVNRYPTHSVIWTDDTEFGHMHLVEVARGCPWKCRFCATPPLYAPYRTRSMTVVMESIEYGLTQRKHIGLIGADVLGHPDFAEIACRLQERGIKISTSSLRVNRIDKNVAGILAKSAHRRVALGIEAGSARLRRHMDKDLTDEAIFSAVTALAGAGITKLKLYFMIGLPGEREEDIRAIANLIKEIRKGILQERKSKSLAPDISAVISPFVPKIMTPFEGAGFAGPAYLNSNIKLLRSLIGRIPNVKMTGEAPKRAETEYRLSRADYRFTIDELSFL